MFSSHVSITVLQKNDHRLMEQLMTGYEAASAASKRLIYGQLVELVTTHAFAEEVVLFPAARRVLTNADSLTRDIELTHQHVNELMVEMQPLEPGHPAFDKCAAQLFAILRTDVRKEEDLLLPALGAATDENQMRAIGALWATARRTAPNRPHPGISRRPPGNLLAGLALSITDRAKALLARLRRQAA
jgi:hypothetical protein